MNRKKVMKKLIALSMAACLCVPTLSYIGSTGIFERTQVEAAGVQMDGTKVERFVTDPATGQFYTTTDGGINYITPKYMEAIPDPSAVGGVRYVDISGNPSSEYYTAYRKAEYFRTGNVSAPGQTATFSDKHSGDVMLRFNSDGSRITNFKQSPGDEVGTKGNPLVIVEIVPDEMSSELTTYFGGQEIFDLTYASLFNDASIFTNYRVQAGSDDGGVSVLYQEGIDNTGGQIDGVYYNQNTFMKEIYGFGYENKDLNAAPLVDQYRFCAWYVGDASGKGLMNDELYNSANKLSSIWDYNKFNSVLGGDVHLYAKWQYKVYMGSNGGETVASWSKEGKTYDCNMALSDKNADLVVVDGADTNGNGVIDGGESDVVNFANKVTVDKVTFHLMKPKGTASYTNNKGTFEINVAAAAPISFENDYNFKTTGILGGPMVMAAGIDSWYNGQTSIYDFPYPSLMGNSDFAIKSGDAGHAQVIPVTTKELTEAIAAGKVDAYRELLSKADLIYVKNKQYGTDGCPSSAGHTGGLYKTVKEFVDIKSSPSGVAATDAMKKTVLKSLFKSEMGKSFGDTTNLLKKYNDNFIPDKHLKETDIEGYVLETLFLNMAAQNGSSKIIPVYFDNTAMQGGTLAGRYEGESNLEKLYWLIVMNNDAKQIYEDWYECTPSHAFKLVDRASDRLPYFECAKQTLEITPFVSGVAPTVNWQSFAVIPCTYCYNTRPNMQAQAAGNALRTAEYESLVDKGYAADDNRSGTVQMLTFNAMTYNGDKAVMQGFFSKTAYVKKTEYSMPGFNYLANEKHYIDPSETSTSSALAFKFILNASGGNNIKIVIDNNPVSDVTLSNGKPAKWIEGDLGTDSQNIIYHIVANDGEELRVKYYKLDKNHLSDDVNVNKSLGTELLLGGPADIADATKTVSYRMNNDNTYMKDASNNLVINEIVDASGENFGDYNGAKMIKNAVKYTSNPRLYRLMFNVPTNTLTSATDSYDIYLIYACHEDKRKDVYAYVKVSKSGNTAPFDLD